VCGSALTTPNRHFPTACSIVPKSFFTVTTSLSAGTLARPDGVSSTFSRALAPDAACNPSTTSSVIIFRRSEKTAIPLNTEDASVKIRSVKIARFYRVKFEVCRLRTGAVLGKEFVAGRTKWRFDCGRFREI
jgi:hypothetical protein